MKPRRAAPTIALLSTAVLSITLYSTSPAAALAHYDHGSLSTPIPTITFTKVLHKPWEQYHHYKFEDLASYDGVNYKCIQAHPSFPGWEPPNVPTLWQRL
ncbi:carbohydrate-binding protein [Streptosporangium sp. NPDC051022]|uniref:carbohydrate-binding protein n=1 Tax=Streptosporangium sp. NPDC051022 TaxID=3155752 RepID=UPI0034436787